MTLFLEVTQDEYSLPTQVADSIPHLAKIVGVPKGRIYCSMERFKKRMKAGKITRGKSKYPKYVKVEIPEGELITDEMWQHYLRWKEKKNG